MTAIPDKELDYHYSPSHWSHRMGPTEVLEAHVKILTEASRAAQWCLDVEADIIYGQSECQRLDIYTKSSALPKKGSPIFVYIHGGYWQAKGIGWQNSCFMAVPLSSAGATIISIGYNLCPDVSMDEIVSQIKQATRCIINLAKDRHSTGIYLCGHSAGAHLATMMLMSSFSDDDAYDSDLIKGAVLVSGIYDLRPLVKTSINDALHLTVEDAWQFSPANFVKEIAHHSAGRDILVVVGEYDPPEFRRQSGEFEKSLRDSGVRTRYMDIPDTDHFSIIEKLQENSYSLTKECLRMMNLPRK